MWPEILSTKIRYFVVNLRFVAIYALYGRFGEKSTFFGTTKVFHGQELHYYMVYIAKYAEFDCKFAVTRKNDAVATKIANMGLTKILEGIIALAERLPTSATLI